MEGLELFNVEHAWNPFERFGFHSDLLKINLDTVVNTWIVLLVLILFILICQLFLHKSSILTSMVHSFVTFFIDLTTQSLGIFNYHHFAFIFSIFIFIVFCNWISLIPFIEEPTRDINTALSLGFISFFYKEFYAIKIHGFIAYIKGFLHPIFIMFPLNVISHFSKIISISFRLFGNIFGGSIITQIYTGAISASVLAELFGLFSGINFLIISFFVLFEGLIQAFVFTMLTITYLAIATQSTEEGALE
jgi:F-type H+-transporting ATPase subunit a